MICSACTDENETNNGKRTDCYNGTPLTVRATATGFENVPGSEKPSTRASVTDEHLKTEFVDGDSIGIFSIKDGTIVDDINNIPLVYNVSNDSWNSVWTAVFQDGKAFVYAIWHECNWIKGVWKKIGLPVFFYAYHEAAIPLMQIKT